MVNEPFVYNHRYWYYFNLIIWYISFVFIFPLIIYLLKRSQIIHDYQIVLGVKKRIREILKIINIDYDIDHLVDQNSITFNNPLLNTKELSSLIEETNVLVGIYNQHVKLIKDEFYWYPSKWIIIRNQVENFRLLNKLIENNT